jgi:hypothetical protein
VVRNKHFVWMLSLLPDLASSSQGESDASTADPGSGR